MPVATCSSLNGDSIGIPGCSTGGLTCCVYDCGKNGDVYIFDNIK